MKSVILRSLFILLTGLVFSCTGGQDKSQREYTSELPEDFPSELMLQESELTKGMIESGVRKKGGYVFHYPYSADIALKELNTTLADNQWMITAAVTNENAHMIEALRLGKELSISISSVDENEPNKSTYTVLLVE